MEEIKGGRLFLYNLSSAGHAVFDNLLNFYYAIFLLPPAEKIAEGMKKYIAEETFLGVFTVLGLIMIIARLVDGFADPFIGFFSDRSRSPFGRRRKFMLLASLPLAISTTLIFFPPLPEVSFLNAVYYAVIFSSCFFFYTMYVAPYIALIPELSKSEKTRVSMTTAQGYFVLAGGAVTMIGGPLLIALSRTAGDVTFSYRIMAVIMCAVGFVLLLCAVFAANEKRFVQSTPPTTKFFASVKIVVKNRRFMIFLAANMTLWFIFNTIRSALNHVTITLMRGSESDAGLCFIVIFGSAALFFLLVWRLARTIGKKKVMAAGLLSFCVLGGLLALTGIMPIPPFAWAMAIFALMGFPVAVFLVVPNVFISEACDLDFQATGQKREAMYFGVHGFFQTLTMGLTAAVLSFFFSVFGKDIANPLGVRLTLLFAVAVALIGLAVISRYPVKSEAAPASSP